MVASVASVASVPAPAGGGSGDEVRCARQLITYLDRFVIELVRYIHTIFFLLGNVDKMDRDLIKGDEDGYFQETLLKSDKQIK